MLECIVYMLVWNACKVRQPNDDSHANTVAGEAVDWKLSANVTK